MAYWDSISLENREKLAALSYEQVCSMLEDGDELVEDAVEKIIEEYAEICAEPLQRGEDYLPTLMAIPVSCPLQKVAVEILEEAFEEELEDA